MHARWRGWGGGSSHDPTCPYNVPASHLVAQPPAAGVNHHHHLRGEAVPSRGSAERSCVLTRKDWVRPKGSQSPATVELLRARLSQCTLRRRSRPPPLHWLPHRAHHSPAAHPRSAAPQHGAAQHSTAHATHLPTLLDAHHRRGLLVVNLVHHLTAGARRGGRGGAAGVSSGRGACCQRGLVSRHPAPWGALS